MASLPRKTARKLQFQNVMLDVLLFGGVEAPNADCLEERRRLIAKFRDIMIKFKARDPAQLYAYLRDACTMNPKRPVGSHLDLIDDIDALRAVEAEERAGIKTEGNGDVAGN